MWLRRKFQRMKLEVTVVPTYCNHWPTFQVSHNSTMLFDQEVDKETTLEFDVSEEPENILRFAMSGKQFGPTTWDTHVDENGNVTADLTLTITDVRVDEVPVLDLLIKNQYYVIRQSGQDHIDELIYSEGIMNFNGDFRIILHTPVLNDITNQKFKQDLDADKSYFSNYTTVFHYDRDEQIIDEIYDILNDIKELNS